MKREDVPQEGNATLGGVRKAVYAQDESGRFTTVPSRGWAVEETVTTMAVDLFRQQAEAARQRVLEGKASPLAFHMYNRRMDATVLAQSTGLFGWQVRRHLKPGPFQRLNAKKLARYAQALDLSISALKTIPQEPLA
ncbi:hypothetical protein [Alkalilimnicola sp. S0819]|uniref:hypothetical protein n=1 Tax=Alkalilimnicola sp. S0819 TaxID=2613922 RepID=UPI0012628274|nr:hypothetical protein [Alkalilimnicola sp. S0819]KAB7624164.1 hypothetical protein F3N43_07180 [Alkalilimnicola sp. S0819]MPQ16417.1 hypothetical protein [Alkalilimnicola sp. S0819]